MNLGEEMFKMFSLKSTFFAYFLPSFKKNKLKQRAQHINKWMKPSPFHTKIKHRCSEIEIVNVYLISILS